MTDGIIQEVFDKLYKEHEEKKLSYWKCDIVKLQQELIEKIKQEFWDNNDTAHSKDIRKWLIGDNKE